MKKSRKSGSGTSQNNPERTATKEPRLILSALLLFSLELSQLRRDESSPRIPSPKSPRYRSLARLVLSCFCFLLALSVTSEPCSHQYHLFLIYRSRRETSRCSHPCPWDSLPSFVFVRCSSANREAEIIVYRSSCYS